MAQKKKATKKAPAKKTKKKASAKKPAVMGRPTTYSADIVRKSIAYLKRFVDGKPPKFETIPTVVGLCRHINRSKSTVYFWRDEGKKRDFLDILEAIEEMQEVMLIQGGVTGMFNSAITKMLLTKHGYSEKQDVDVTSGGEPLRSIAPEEWVDGSMKE